MADHSTGSQMNSEEIKVTTVYSRTFIEVDISLDSNDIT
jgi:hypothetical protein